MKAKDSGEVAVEGRGSFSNDVRVMLWVGDVMAISLAVENIESGKVESSKKINKAIV